MISDELDRAWLQRLVHAAAEAGAKKAVSQLQKREREDRGGGFPALGAITTKYREKDGLIISHLAHMAGLHPTTIGKIEAGQRGMSLYTFSRLSRILGMQYAGEVITLVGGWPDV